MLDIHVDYRDIEEPELFENITSFEANKDNKFLFLFADLGNGIEWYLPLENILCFQIDYKEEVK
jgi:hypothetical protein